MLDNIVSVLRVNFLNGNRNVIDKDIDILTISLAAKDPWLHQSFELSWINFVSKYPKVTHHTYMRV